MSKELIVSVTPQETKAAILENDQVIEIHIERDKEHGVVGAICKGRVMKVLPGMQSAFVDIGLERDAFLYVSDFFEDADEYDKLVTTAEEQVEKLGQPAATVSPVVPFASALTPIPDNPLAATPGGSKFQDRRGRSRRSRRFRLKGKHYEAAPPAAAPAPSVQMSPAPVSVAPSVSPADAEDTQPALSLLPGESLAKYQDPLTETSVETAAEAFLAGSESADEAPEMEAGESSDLPLSATGMAELDSDEEEQVAEVLAAAEVLSGSFLAEPQEVRSPEELEPAETSGTLQVDEVLSEESAPAPVEASAFETSPLPVSTTEDTQVAAVSSDRASAASAPAEAPATDGQPADFTRAECRS